VRSHRIVTSPCARWKARTVGRVGQASALDEGAGERGHDRGDRVRGGRDREATQQVLGVPTSFERDRREHQDQIEPRGADAGLGPVDEDDATGWLDEDVVAANVEMHQRLSACSPCPPGFECDELVEMGA
jgi:hypothetical protein